MFGACGGWDVAAGANPIPSPGKPFMLFGNIFDGTLGGEIEMGSKAIWDGALGCGINSAGNAAGITFPNISSMSTPTMPVSNIPYNTNL